MKENWNLMRFSKKIIVFTMGVTLVYATVYMILVQYGVVYSPECGEPVQRLDQSAGKSDRGKQNRGR